MAPHEWLAFLSAMTIIANGRRARQNPRAGAGVRVLREGGLNIEERLKEIRRESSSDAAGDPERFRRVALTETR
jgi:hypothetical protein